MKGTKASVRPKPCFVPKTTYRCGYQVETLQQNNRRRAAFLLRRILLASRDKTTISMSRATQRAMARNKHRYMWAATHGRVSARHSQRILTVPNRRGREEYFRGDNDIHVVDNYGVRSVLFLGSGEERQRTSVQRTHVVVFSNTTFYEANLRPRR